MSAFTEIGRVAPQIIERVVPAIESAAGKLFADSAATSRATASTARLLEGAANSAQRTAAAEKLLSTERIVLKERAVPDGGFNHTWTSELRSGYIDVEGAPPHGVVLRPATEKDGRAFKELANYGLHKISPFEHTFPTTVLRNDDAGRSLIVQERIGRSIADRATMLSVRENEPGSSYRVFERLMKSSDDFARQTEHAVIERTIFGDMDTHLGNLSLATARGRIVVGSIDPGQSMTLLRRPFPPRIDYFRGRSLTDDSLSKVEEFADTLSSRSNKPLFQQLDLTRQHIDRMIGRSSWILRNRRLPTEMDL